METPILDLPYLDPAFSDSPFRWLLDTAEKEFLIFLSAIDHTKYSPAAILDLGVGFAHVFCEKINADKDFRSWLENELVEVADTWAIESGRMDMYDLDHE